MFWDTPPTRPAYCSMPCSRRCVVLWRRPHVTSLNERVTLELAGSGAGGRCGCRRLMIRQCGRRSSARIHCSSHADCPHAGAPGQWSSTCFCSFTLPPVGWRWCSRLPLAAKKGGSLHRRSGVLFVYAMLAMASSAALLGNVAGGLMTIYFVGTAWMTIRSESRWTRSITAACMLFAAVFAILTVGEGVEAFNSPGGFLNGVPFPMLFFLALVAALAAAGDVRVLRFGVPRGGPRLARHLWRMCFALFIAAGSFFSIRERVATILPEPFTTGADARAADPAAVWRDVLLAVESPRRRPLPVRHDSMPLATRT